mgnify:CR=1 FL=1
MTTKRLGTVGKHKSTKNALATIAITTIRRDTNKPTTRHFPDADVAELYAVAVEMNTTVGALVEDIVAAWVATKRCARTHEGRGQLVIGFLVKDSERPGVEGGP